MRQSKEQINKLIYNNSNDFSTYIRSEALTIGKNIKVKI